MPGIKMSDYSYENRAPDCHSNSDNYLTSLSSCAYADEDHNYYDCIRDGTHMDSYDNPAYYHRQEMAEPYSTEFCYENYAYYPSGAYYGLACWWTR